MYIGLSENIERRYREHTNGNDMKSSRIDRAMVKYGEDKFDLEIIEELPNDRTLLMEREEYWVAYYSTYEDKNHYNLTPGGDFCPMKAPEIAAKVSKVNSGKNHPMYGKKLPEKTRKKISKALSGENNPAKLPEVRAKLSKALSGKNNPMYGKKGEESPNFGRKHTQKSREKISKAHSGKKLSQKTKDKLSKINSGENNPFFGHKHTPEARKKISKARNTSGYYRVYKRNEKGCKQGFIWRYEYHEDGRKKSISSVDIKKLEEKVRAKGLEWIKFD